MASLAGVADRIPVGEALERALATWPAGQVAKIHYSSPRTAIEERETKKGRRVERQPVLPPLRAHADLIDPIGFEDFLRGPGAGRDFDLMLEAKAKDLALLRLRDQLEERDFDWRDGSYRAEPVLGPGPTGVRAWPQLGEQDARIESAVDRVVATIWATRTSRWYWSGGHAKPSKAGDLA